MKNFLKSSALCLIALATLASAPARAQKHDDRVLVDRQTARDARLISAKAGGVNFVSGDVKARRADGKDWLSVSVKDDLRSGDSARTGEDGRVEVLLNPGSYLRAGASTEFELEDSSLDNLRLRLARGSVLVEATGYGDLGLDIEIATPQTRVSIVRTGVYRIDVSPSGETSVRVEKGRALVGEGPAGLLVKAGKVARVGAQGGVEVAKQEKKQRDPLDQWSRDRGKELAKVNDALANRQTNALLASYSGFPDIFRADVGNPMGIWMWSANRSCYTFLPFYTGWRSPYGYWYGSFFPYPAGYGCWGCPSYGYRSPTIVYNGNQPPNTNVGRGVTPPTPGGGNNGGGFGGGNNGGGTIAPPPSAAAPVHVGNPVRDSKYEPGVVRPRDQ